MGDDYYRKRHGDWAPPGPAPGGYGRGSGRFGGRRGRYDPHGGPPRDMFAGDRLPRGHFPGRGPGPAGRREPGRGPPGSGDWARPLPHMGADAWPPAPYSSGRGMRDSFGPRGGGPGSPTDSGPLMPSSSRDRERERDRERDRDRDRELSDRERERERERRAGGMERSSSAAAMGGSARGGSGAGPGDWLGPPPGSAAYSPDRMGPPHHHADMMRSVSGRGMGGPGGFGPSQMQGADREWERERDYADRGWEGGSAELPRVGSRGALAAGAEGRSAAERERDRGADRDRFEKAERADREREKEKGDRGSRDRDRDRAKDKDRSKDREKDRDRGKGGDEKRREGKERERSREHRSREGERGSGRDRSRSPSRRKREAADGEAAAGVAAAAPDAAAGAAAAAVGAAAPGSSSKHRSGSSSRRDKERDRPRDKDHKDRPRSSSSRHRSSSRQHESSSKPSSKHTKPQSAVPGLDAAAATAGDSVVAADGSGAVGAERLTAGEGADGVSASAAATPDASDAGEHQQQPQQQQERQRDLPAWLLPQHSRRQHVLESTEEEAGEVHPTASTDHSEDEMPQQHAAPQQHAISPAAAAVAADGAQHEQQQQHDASMLPPPPVQQQQQLARRASGLHQQQEHHEQVHAGSMEPTLLHAGRTSSMDDASPESWEDPVEVGLAAAAEAAAQAAALAAADDMQVDAMPGLVQQHAADDAQLSAAGPSDSKAVVMQGMQLPPSLPESPVAMQGEAVQPGGTAVIKQEEEEEQQQQPLPPPPAPQQQQLQPGLATSASDAAAADAAADAAAVEAAAAGQEDGPSRKRRRLGFGQGLARLAMQPGGAGPAAPGLAAAAGTQSGAVPDNTAAPAAAAAGAAAAVSGQAQQLQQQGSEQLPGDAAQQQQQTPALTKADISRALSKLEDQVIDLEKQLKDLEMPADVLTSKLAAAHQEIVQLEKTDLMAAAREELELWLDEERQRRKAEREVEWQQRRREQQERKQREHQQKQQEREQQEEARRQQREHAQLERQQRRLEQEANRAKMAVAAAALRARPPESAGIALPLKHGPAAASVAAAAARLQGAAALQEANKASAGPADLQHAPGGQIPAAARAAAATGNHLQLQQHWRSSERDDIARQAIVDINTAKARAARLALSKLLPDSMQEEAQHQLAAAQPLKRQYTTIKDLPEVWQDLQQRHEEARPGVRRFVTERAALLHAKQSALADRYKAGVSRFQEYLKRESEAATAAAQAAAAAAAGGYGSARGAGGAYGGAFGGGGRLTRASAAYADPYQSAVLRSAHDEQQVMRSFRALEALKHMTNTPQQQLDPWQRRWSGFASNNGFVEDPEKELDEETWGLDWSLDEVEQFKELYITHGKDFRIIAQHLPQRTPAEAMMFYYRHQKSEDFAAVRRKTQLRKRRHATETNRFLSGQRPMAITALQESRRARGRERELREGTAAAPAFERPVPASRQPQPLQEQQLDWGTGGGLYPAGSYGVPAATAAAGQSVLDASVGGFALPGAGRSRGGRGGGRGASRGGRGRAAGEAADDDDADADYTPRAADKQDRGKDGRRSSAEDGTGTAADAERDQLRLDELVREGILRHGLDFDRVADDVVAARINLGGIKKLPWYIKRQHKRLDFDGLLEQRRQQEAAAEMAVLAAAAAITANALAGVESAGQAQRAAAAEQAPAAAAAAPAAQAQAEPAVGDSVGQAAAAAAAAADIIAEEPQPAAGAAAAAAAAGQQQQQDAEQAPQQQQVQQQQQEEEEEEGGSPGTASERAQWTAADRSTFLEQLKQQGKNFTGIAAHIPGKTLQQCRSFYTNNKDKLGLDELIPKELQPQPQQKGKGGRKSRVTSSSNLAAAAAAAGDAPEAAAVPVAVPAEAPQPPPAAAAAAAEGGSALHSPDAAEIMQAAFATTAVAAPAGGASGPAHDHQLSRDLADAAAAVAMSASMRHGHNAAAGHGYDAAAAAACASEAEWWALQQSAAMRPPAPVHAPASAQHHKRRGGGGGRRQGGGKRQKQEHGKGRGHPGLAAVLQAAAHLLDEDDEYEQQPAAEEAEFGQGMVQYEQGYAGAAGVYGLANAAASQQGMLGNLYSASPAAVAAGADQAEGLDTMASGLDALAAAADTCAVSEQMGTAALFANLQQQQLQLPLQPVLQERPSAPLRLPALSAVLDGTRSADGTPPPAAAAAAAVAAAAAAVAAATPDSDRFPAVFQQQKPMQPSALHARILEQQSALANLHGPAAATAVSRPHVAALSAPLQLPLGSSLSAPFGGQLGHIGGQAPDLAGFLAAALAAAPPPRPVSAPPPPDLAIAQLAAVLQQQQQQQQQQASLQALLSSQQQQQQAAGLQALLGGGAGEATARLLLQQLMHEPAQSAPLPQLQAPPQPRNLQATRSAQQAALLAALQSASGLPQHAPAPPPQPLVRPASSAPFLPGGTGISPLLTALSGIDLAGLLNVDRGRVPASAAAPASAALVAAAAAAAAAAATAFGGDEPAAKRSRQDN